jgi:hypothetical protein
LSRLWAVAAATLDVCNPGAMKELELAATRKPNEDLSEKNESPTGDEFSDGEVVIYRHFTDGEVLSQIGPWQVRYMTSRFLPPMTII